MQCLKCGRDTAEGQVFCAPCAKDMEKYPIRPGTPVAIPTRPKRAPRAAQQPKAEEQLARLRTRLCRIRICAGVLLLALIASLSVLGYTLWNQEEGFSIGQNYSTVTGPAQQGGR